MNPRTATRFTVGMLLLTAVLITGGRYAHDDLLRQNHQGGTRTTAGANANRITASATESRRRERGIGPRPTAVLTAQIHAVLQVPFSNDRSRALLDLCAHFSPEDWPGALAIMDEIDKVKWREESNLLLHAWAEEDPVKAVKWAAASRPNALFLVVETWVRLDAPAAVAWITARGLDDTPSQMLMCKALANLGSDLPLMFRTLQNLPEDRRRFMTDQIRMDLSQVPRGSLNGWLQGMDSAQRHQMLSFTLERLDEPELRAELLQDFPGEMGPDELMRLYCARTREAPDEELAALDTTPSGEMRDAMIKGLAWGFADSRQIPQALDAIDRNPEAADVSVLNEIVRGSTSSDAERVLGYMPLISDWNSRIEMSRTMLETWKEKDPEAVKQWVRTHEVAEVLKQEFDK